MNRRIDDGTTPFNGRIDELGIWDIELDQTQIQELKNQGNPYNPIQPTEIKCRNTDCKYIRFKINKTAFGICELKKVLIGKFQKCLSYEQQKE